jgi:hypothetical protein
MDAELKELFAVLIGQQAATSKSIGDLAATVGKYVEASDARQEATSKSIGDLAETVGKYVEASDARMKRLEENLDGLIRAITSEHSNGKAH